MSKEKLIYQQVRDFSKSKSLDELNNRLKKILNYYDINTFSFTYYKQPPKAIQKVQYNTCSDDYINWNLHFLSENYNTLDTTLFHSYQSSLPQKWLVAEQLKDAGSKREKQMREDSLDFGAVGGFSFPVHGPNHDFAHFVIVAMREQSFLDKWPSLEFDLSAVARHYFSASVNLISHENGRGGVLSQRELDCLLLVAEKYSTQAIASMLNISPRTVHFHLQNANKKLGVSNRYESVCAAKECGII
ncbi:LuxR C-terminal-related transcriptional regulator [Vibrio sp. S4M6]|nr:LuxR C-terminal-related transcriptional regulator [Vibrio sinus]MCL9782111.1 LuxR C-terminal-related transcriptional regulator [Vibrio sinus]